MNKKLVVKRCNPISSYSALETGLHKKEKKEMIERYYITCDYLSSVIAGHVACY